MTVAPASLAQCGFSICFVLGNGLDLKHVLSLTGDKSILFPRQCNLSKTRKWREATIRNSAGRHWRAL